MLHVPVKCACRILCVHTHYPVLVYTTCVKCTCKFESERKLKKYCYFYLFLFLKGCFILFYIHMTTTFDSKLDLTYQGAIKIFMGFSLYFFLERVSLGDLFMLHSRLQLQVIRGCIRGEMFQKNWTLDVV